MRSIWNELPMLRYYIAICAGVALAIFCDQTLPDPVLSCYAMIAVLLLSLCFAIGFSYLSIGAIYKYRHLIGLFLSSALVALGFVLTYAKTEKHRADHLFRSNTLAPFTLVEINKPVQIKDKIVMAEVVVLAIGATKDKIIQKEAKAILNFSRDTLSEKLNYGDRVALATSLRTFDEPKNPYEFSFKRYQNFHNIYHRGFVKTGQWKLISSGHGSWLFRTVYQLKAYFLSVIRAVVRDKNDFAVASALMLGYRDFMNEEVVTAYATSGALHVLSVSGLHVGIMFLMLNFFLTGLDSKGRRLLYLKAAIIILFIWFYACITGLSPSVLRAAAMFSMVQIAKVLQRNANTFNVIAGSALVLTIHDPFIVTEIGFRLSYLAVIGIIYLQPKIYSLFVICSDKKPAFRSAPLFKKPLVFIMKDLGWFFKYALPDFVWQLTAVSIAAQIAAFPISLYYFHQFPSLFLVANLVVIPVGNLILFSGVALMILWAVPFLGAVTGKVFCGLVHLLNQFIFLIETLPFSLIDGITITWAEMLLMYLLFLSVVWMVKSRSVPAVYMSLLLLLVLAISSSFEKVMARKNREFVVYHIPNKSAAAFIAGPRAVTRFDPAVSESRSAMLFHIQHHWWAVGVNESREISESDEIRFPLGSITTFHGRSIAFINKAPPKLLTGLEQKLAVDLLVISGNPKIYFRDLSRLLSFDKVIFDTSNKPWRMKYWKNDCAKMNIPFWDVSAQGAYREQWP